MAQQKLGLDVVSDRILRELQRDGRISNVDLAGRVGLSASACLRRVQELERSGIIRGYRAVLDRTKLGAGFIAVIAVGLSDHSKAAQKAFERSISKSSEVTECHNVTGSVEYMLRVEVADLAAYKTFHTDVLGAIPTVASLTTYVVLASPKDERA
jgi:Lrp/AsnC family transcriptional regulator, leucine-responsive regulatory protein